MTSTVLVLVMIIASLVCFNFSFTTVMYPIGMCLELTILHTGRNEQHVFLPKVNMLSPSVRLCCKLCATQCTVNHLRLFMVPFVDCW